MEQVKAADVAVIGLGPAGSTAAYLLAKAGFKVIGIDYQDFPRPKLCAGLLTLKTRALVNEIKVNAWQELSRNKVVVFLDKTYQVHFGDKANYLGRLKKPFAIVERKAYDYYWWNQAKASGVEMVRDKVVGIDFKNSLCLLKSGKKIRAKYILGADGVMSTLRKKLAQENEVIYSPGNKFQVFCLEGWLKRDQIKFGYFPHLFFRPDLDGYIWLFPAKQGWSIGLLNKKERNGKALKRYLGQFVRNYLNVELGLCAGHYLPYGDFETKPWAKNCFLLGDAAGLADPILGEGIYYAHKSGWAVAKAISQGKEQDEVGRIFLNLLQKDLRELKLFSLTRNLIFGLGKLGNFWAMRTLFELGASWLEDLVQGQRFIREL